ncbi:MAG: phosphate/phosphite/phosphonate ABC transporter substrate-binding protein [Desulfobulbaceae bacterium]|nr:phosphate/phosphite/phosphonate ABC transporter substrate-binding protein [Desulfobulbaceae bacterium]
MRQRISRFYFSSFLLSNRCKRRNSYRPFFVSLCAVFCFLLSIFVVYAATKLEFYYFNPDCVQSNLSQLSSGFNSLFKKFGLDAGFQAFAHKRDFDQRLKERPPDLILVPSWYFEQYGKALGLTPLLTSLENGKPSYTKYLLVRKDFGLSVKELKGKTVAMTTMGANAEELLNTNYFKDQGVDFSAMNIIITPKDADALYALLLGQVDAALVGQATLDTIDSVGLRTLEGTKRLMASSPVPTPLLCVLPGSVDKVEVAQMKNILLKKSEKNPSAELMDKLYINDWQKVF